VTEPVGHQDGQEGSRRVRFVPVVRLTKQDVFAACQALADADRCLVRDGHHREAHALGNLFERLEAQLTASDAYRPADSEPAPSSAPCPGWYSSESELTQ
jgi:hypothetical protein